jgi:hypothetical protein
MVEERIVNCPFCGKMTVKVLHQPFVARANLTKSRLGSGMPRYTKEKTEVLSGCGGCGKSREDVEKYFNKEKEVTPDEHKKRLERLRAAGFGTQIVNKRR